MASNTDYIKKNINNQRHTHFLIYRWSILRSIAKQSKNFVSLTIGVYKAKSFFYLIGISHVWSAKRQRKTLRKSLTNCGFICLQKNVENVDLYLITVRCQNCFSYSLNLFFKYELPEFFCYQKTSLFFKLKDKKIYCAYIYFFSIYFQLWPTFIDQMKKINRHLTYIFLYSVSSFAVNMIKIKILYCDVT